MLTLVQLFWLSVFASTHLVKVSEANLPYVRFAGSSTVFPVTDAWSNQLLTEYDFKVEGGGSSTGAKRVCLPRDDPDHVDVGAMSRNWKDSEAVRLDDTYTLECTKESWNGTKVRVTQLQVATDGLAVVVKLNGAGHRCLTSPEVGGLTLAQLRWIYSDWSDSDLADDKDGHLNMLSVAPNDDGDGIKEWSDLHEGCDQVPINPYGAGDQSGTHDFFGEVVLCEKCFKGNTGYTPEYFKTCNLSAVHHLEQMSTTDAAAYITSGRDKLGTPNCYAPTEDDDHIYNWVMADEGGIGYFGFAYYSINSATLTAIRIAGDKVNGIGDTAEAKIAPTSYSITDGSYSVFTRNLYMNVDNHAWDLVRRFMQFGFSNPGQTLVANVGYVTVNAAIHAKMMIIINRGANIEADYVPQELASCPLGHEMTSYQRLNQWGKLKNDYRCTPCSPGTFKNDDGVQKCSPCPLGFFSLGSASSCNTCGEGFFASGGSSTCTACPINHISGAGSGNCIACSAGSFTTSNASASCERCPAGKFRPSLPKNASCQVCPGGTTTLYLGAESLSDCLCGEGYYLKPGANIEIGSLDVCASCPEGMTCAAGSQYDNFAKWQSGSLESKSLHSALPQVELGFMTLASKPLEVYRCLPPDVCPGGPPGSCGDGRDNKRVACGRCPDGQVQDGNTCSECGFMDRCTFFLFLLVATIFAFVGYYAVSSKLTAKLSTMLSISMVFGSLIGLVQTLGIFSLLSTPWPSDFRHFLAAMSIFAADFDAFTIGCAFGDFSPVVHFASTCVFFPYVILALCVFYFVSRLFANRFVWTPENTKNVMGAWCQISFTSMCGVGSSAFVLVEHPMGSSSVVKYTELLTSSSEYVGVAILGSVVLAFALTFYCICMYALVRAPKKAAEGDTRFLQSCRFLLVRFRVDVWWWGLHMMARSLLISLCPTIATGEPRFQMIMICIIISASVLATSRFRPWRAPSLNGVDISICFVLMMLVLTATAFVDKATGSWADFYSTLLYVLTAVAFCIMLFMVFLSATAVFRRGPIGTIYDVAPCQTFPDPARLAMSISQLSEEAALRPVEKITEALQEMQVYDLWLLSKSLSIMLETGILSQEKPRNWRQMSVRTSSFTKEIVKERKENPVAEEPDSGNTNLGKETGEPDPEESTI